MRILIQKELTSLFGSGIGLIFSFIFLVTCGLILWIFAGNFNILDAGYASLDKFVTLSSILFIVLIPSLTMRLFSEEKKSGTFTLLRSRPFSISEIWFSKWISTCLFVIVVLLCTSVYVFSIYKIASPVGNVDLTIIFVSYLSLIVLAAVLISIGLFASSLTDNQIVAFSVAIILNLFFFYGIDLLSSLFNSGVAQYKIMSCGLYFHFQNMQRGVVELTDVSTLIMYIIVFWILSLCILNLKNRPIKKHIIITLGCIVIISMSNFAFPFVRLDLTQDKRYSLNDYSKELMTKIGKDKELSVKINIYLDGDLNPGFQRLKNATIDIVTDLNRYADNKINISVIDPISTGIAREELPQYMASKNMPGVLLNEVDRNGKLSQQLIYPYAEVIVNNDTLQTSLLHKIAGNTAEENLNASAENLEFEFIDAIRLLLKNEELDIAFIEGHGELDRVYLQDAEEALAKYFFVNRGQIGNDISVLDNFKVVIIAGPTEKYSETEKYILDQYLMKGGRILWLVDGAYVSKEELIRKGQSASIKNETNLDDLLFSYGVRIEGNLIQDNQSSHILVNTGKDSHPIIIPWYYSPLLLSSTNNQITKNTGVVKSEFISSLSLLNKAKVLSPEVLLTTSQYSRIIQIPELIDFEIQKVQNETSSFDSSFLPIAVSLEGQFQSAYKNRPMPDSIHLDDYQTQHISKATKMIVVSTSSIIKNEIEGLGDKTKILPMGYDRILKQRFGNRVFIVNAVNWLANDKESISLKSINRTLNLLDKRTIIVNRNQYAIINTALPILFVLLIWAIVNIRRYRNYGR